MPADGRNPGFGRRTWIALRKLRFIQATLGFVHPAHKGMLSQLGVALDAQGNVRANTDNYQTSLNQVFSAGDMRRGQSLVVWAIREGRQCTQAVDEFLGSLVICVANY